MEWSDALMLLVALSALQGRPMKRAFDELIALADGVQLTPGNHPTPGFEAHVQQFSTRTHHGFAFGGRGARVWDGVTCRADSDSVHPPQLDANATNVMFRRAIEDGARVPVLETMYPGYALGEGDELEWAMARRLPLAVDVSHLYMQ